MLMLVPNPSRTAFCRSRNGESGNGMREMRGTRGITVGTPGIKVGMRRIKDEQSGWECGESG